LIKKQKSVSLRSTEEWLSGRKHWFRKPAEVKASREFESPLFRQLNFCGNFSRYMNLLINIFWIFAPAAAANMAPVFAENIPILKTPVDFNATFNGVRILGDHKTWRGILFGLLAAAAIAALQNYLIGSNRLHPIVFGTLIGGGALAGDLIKSFIKRRLGIPPGESFLIADQIDWVLGALIVSSFLYRWSFLSILIILVFWGILHILTNLVGYWLGIREKAI
jgi:CDP-2,3-bis-(O-geranylgeranyl)-sn-glycerol synthase